MLLVIGMAAAQSQRDWKTIRNNRNNMVQIFEPIPMFNNFRKVQPIGDYRQVYRSKTASGECLASCSTNSTACVKPPMTRTKRRRAYSTFFHWDYSDQRRWGRWIHPMRWENECNVGGTGPTQWGESPINIDPREIEVNEEPFVNLSSGWYDRRPFLFVGNTGHSVQLTVCGNNIYDCRARANFGDWPCKMHGSTCNDTDYILNQVHFHFGEDYSKGSEHQVCGSPRSAEMHMVFINSRWGHPEDPVPWELDNPGRGVRLLVLATLVEVGDEDNDAFQPILDAVKFPKPRQSRHFRDRGVAHWGNSSGPTQGPIDLRRLLPEDLTKFYTYPGSLTTPPCSQFVSWYVFENAIRWSEYQFEQIRSATTYYHFPHVHPHFYAVILFACVMLILGTITKQFLAKHAPQVPYTMVVMLWGFVLNFLASINNDGQLNPFQQSLRMWSNIDGHLALYVFLPALIFGDVMKINFHIFLQTLKQACFLAGPGVLLSAYLTALVVKYVLPYGWSWSFSMAIGSILAATDPVAVLALMKNLGAPKPLTMQVAGESLLNDGTSVILFSIFFDMSRKRRGQYASALRLFRIMARFLVFSPCLGIVVGAVSVYWMARVRHSKAGSLVQLSVTLIAAYLGFFLSDDTKIGQASGILTTVAAGLVLAYRVWPVVISKEAMENVWSTLEHILNTLIFGLVGVQMSRGKLSHNVNWRELYWCVVLYVCVFAIRAVIVFISVPLLNLLGPHKVTRKESTFIVLGGLRGAVSLSLAIFVKQIRSNTLRTWPHDNDHDAERTLFLVGGVAFLTLLVNAPIAHPLLARFDMIAAADASKQPIVQSARERIQEAAEHAYAETCLKLNHDATLVTTLCRNLEKIPSQTPVADALAKARNNEPVKLMPGDNDDEERGFSADTLDRQLGGRAPETAKLPVLRDTFLSVVLAHYWRMIDEGELPKTAKATILLLRSIDVAKDNKNEINDFHVLQELMDDVTISRHHERCFEAIDRITPNWLTVGSELFYKFSYECYEVDYYMLRAYNAAHCHAQRVFVRAMCGAALPGPEILTVLLESARLVELARGRLDKISPNLKAIVKSKIIGERVIEAQRHMLHKLTVQGVLEEADAEMIAGELDDDEQNLIVHRKQQTHAITKFAALKELPIVANRDVEWDVDFEYQENPSITKSKRKKSKQNLLESIEQVESQMLRANSHDDMLKHDDNTSNNSHVVG
ncbi:hypothetical protein CTAYLR_007489 [Chrysophaeum taylorii]|uniref:Alpha-carbonic anhydrase domain-containing protein n=1 Tax=Chrysophaeum taylorii TaxID=2483200 RepID=A0AAD7XHM1_9STRA|nr:hypothetical protein CTAYLR_007489 [Chrysophaeum taylorii]